MPTPEPLVRLLHAAYAAPADGVMDAELLARVAAGKDDAAFELLVRRYAELVWRVCRAVTRDHHAAEDAFQAAFLALATKAGAVRGEVGGWLYRVAYHAALKARKAVRHEPRGLPPWSAADTTGVNPVARQASLELAALLYDELNRLSDAYRVPVVLCHLRGFTQAEAAERLGLPPGTVATRVRRGLARLRDRLARRGVALPAAVAAASTAAAPPKLVAAAAGLTAATAPPAITHLSQEALAAMKPTPWTLAAGVAVCLAGAVALTAAVADPPKPADPPPAAAAAVAKKFVPAPSTHAQRKQSSDNLKKVGLAIHDYEAAHGHFPQDIRSRDGKPLLSWRVALLPQLDQEFLYSQFKLDEPWDSEHNKKLLAFAPKAYRNAVGQPGTFVKAFAGPGAAYEPGKKLTFRDFPDGTVNTIFCVEAGPAVPWTKPEDLPYDPKKPLPAMDGPYTDRLFATSVSGDVYQLRWNLDETTYRRMIERADGMVIGPWDAPPAKPETEEEKKEAAQLRVWVGQGPKRLQDLSLERTRLLEELDKLGGSPPADVIGEDAGIEELQKALERQRWQERLLWDEVRQLREEVQKRRKDKK